MAHKKQDQVAKDGDGDPEAPVNDYPARPYSEAVTDEHRKVLEEAHQLPPEE